MIAFGASLIESFQPTVFVQRMVAQMRRGRPGRRGTIVAVQPAALGHRLEVGRVGSHPAGNGRGAVPGHGGGHRGQRPSRQAFPRRTHGRIRGVEEERARRSVAGGRLCGDGRGGRDDRRLGGNSPKRLVRAGRRRRRKAHQRPVQPHGDPLPQCPGRQHRLARRRHCPGASAVDAWPEVPLDEIARRGLSMPRLDGAGTSRFPLAESVPSAFVDAALVGSPYKLSARTGLLHQSGVLHSQSAEGPESVPEGPLPCQLLLVHGRHDRSGRSRSARSHLLGTLAVGRSRRRGGDCGAGAPPTGRRAALRHAEHGGRAHPGGQGPGESVAAPRFRGPATSKRRKRRSAPWPMPRRSAPRRSGRSS